MSAEETVVQERPNVVMLDVPIVEEAKTEEVKEEAKDAEGEQQEEAKSGEEEGQERDETGKFKPKKDLQSRIDQITRKSYEHEREAAYWRGIAETRSAKETTQERPAGKPTADQFEDHSEYVEALTDWKVDQKLGERDQRQEAATKATTWQQRADAVKAEIPDFDTVLAGSTAPMSQAMAQTIQESDMGPKVAYHLAQHPEESARIAGMSPLAAARELGKIEATLSTAKAAEPEPKKVTSAPTPPTPIGSGRSTVGDPGKMSMSDYMAWRDAQRKQK